MTTEATPVSVALTVLYEANDLLEILQSHSEAPEQPLSSAAWTLTDETSAGSIGRSRTSTAPLQPPLDPAANHPAIQTHSPASAGFFVAYCVRERHN